MIRFPSPLRRRSAKSLLAGFLGRVAPVFIVFAGPAIAGIVYFELAVERDQLAARLGNLFARTSAAVSRHDVSGDPRLARDLLAPLQSEAAILCAQIDVAGDIGPLAALPSASGCADIQDGKEIALPAGEGLTVRARFTDAQLLERNRLAAVLTLSVVAAAFLIALFAGAAAFRMMVGRRLRLLGTAIRQRQEGAWAPVDPGRQDELGEVLQTFNRMVADEDALRLTLRGLNRSLEKKVEVRTAELAAATASAEAANEAKSRFLRAASHELRTPLNAVIGFAGVVRQSLENDMADEHTTSFAEEIETAGQKLLGLVNGILLFAEVDDPQSLSRSEVGVRDLVLHHAEKLRAAAEEADLSLTVAEIPRGLPVRIDRKKFGHALDALLDNAVKFNRAGGRVDVDVAPDPAGLEIRIRDTGIGMTPETCERAIGAFAQADEARDRRFEGLGLGLPLAKRIIESHGAALLIDSEPEVGTTVTIRFDEASDIVPPALSA